MALFRERFAFRFGGQPDKTDADEVNERDDRPRLGITAAEGLHEVAHLQGAHRGDDAAKI